MAIQYCNYDIKGTLAVADTSTFSKQLTVSSSVGGDSSWDDSGILIENTSTTTGEPTLAFRNAGTTGTGSNYWFTGLNQNTPYKIAYGTSFTDGNTKFEISTNGSIKFNTYSAGTLVSDASGNITSTSTPPGTGTFLPLAGGTMTGDVRFNDGVEIEVGTSRDLVINHDGSNSYIKQIGTGDLIIRQSTDDRDIIFQGDNSSGGVASYFRLNGSLADGTYTYTSWDDNDKATFGDSQDLQIYHDGSNSYINEAGTGNLIITGSQLTFSNVGDTEYMAKMVQDGTVELYYNGAVRFKTESYGASVYNTAGASSQAVLRVGGSEGNQGSTLELAETLVSDVMTYGFSFVNDGNNTNTLLIKRHNNSSTGDTIVTLSRTSNNVSMSGDLTVSGGDIVLGGTGRIQGVDTVSATTDAANKAYVDAAVAGSGSGSVTSVATGSGLTGGTITTTGTVSVDYGTAGLIADAPGGSGSPDIDDLVLIGQDSSSNGETRAFTLADLPFTNNTGDITGVTAGTLLDGGGTSGTVTLNVDLSELTTATGDMISTDSFAITRSNGSQFKIVPSLIPNNLFANDAGYTTNTGTTTASNTQTFTNKSGNISQWSNNSGYITSASLPTVNNASISITTAAGLDGAAIFTTNQSFNETISLSLDLSELTDMTAAMLGTDEFIVLDAGAERRKAANEIGLSIFSNDAGFITSASLPTVNNATITINAGTNLTTGGNFTTNQGSNETITINMETGGVGAGSYGSTSNSTKIDNITVDAYGRVTAVTTGATGQVNTINTGNSNTLTKSGTTTVTLTPNTGTVSSSSSNLATGAQIQTAINTAVTGVLRYDGVWNASTNSPTLSSGSGTVGEYYIVSVAGSTNLDGITDWAVGDWAVFSDQATDAWQKIDNTQVGNVTGSGSDTRLAVWNSASNITSDSGLTFNTSSNLLTVGGQVNWSGGSSAESNDAYDNTITGFSDSGSSTTTLTLTQRDGGTLTTSFSNPQGDITAVNVGTGLDGGGTSGSVTISLDLSEFTDMTAAMLTTDEFIVLDSGAERRKAAGEIGLSIFSNDAGFITSSSIPSVGNGTLTMTTSTGLDGGATFTANQSGNSTFAVTLDLTEISLGAGLDSTATGLTLDLSEFTDMTATMLNTDEFIVLDAGAERRKAAGEINLSIFNNDSGFTTNTGTVTSVKATTDGNSLGLSGSVTSTGTMTLPWQGSTSQYVRGDGSLNTFPSIPQGTVTSIATTNGITGGTITSTGTIQLDSTVVRTSGNQSIAGVKSFSGKIGADGGIDGLTNANGISGNNYNITGVNVLQINDPGEAIEFSGTTTVYLDVIDDSADDKLRIRNATQLDLNSQARITNLVDPTSTQDAATKTYVDTAVAGSGSGTVTSVATGGGLTGGTITSTGTLSHANTSSQGDVNNSGNTYIQDVVLDTYGHVTSLTSATTTLLTLGYTGATNANYITNNNQLTNGTGYITASSLATLTNKGGNISQWTNDIGYVTSSGGSMSTWKLTADSGGVETITDTETVDIVGGTGITTVRSGANITVNNTAPNIVQTTITGNAGSATVLQTARTIAGVSFNGSANISLNNNAIANGAGYTTNTGTITGSGTDNQVALFNGTTAIEGSVNLTQGSGAFGELGVAGYINHIGGTNERFGWGLSGFIVQAGTNNQTLFVTTTSVRLGYANGSTFTLQTDAKGIRVQDSIGGGNGTIFLGTGGTNSLRLNGTSVFLDSGFIVPTIELKNTGQLDFGAYTTTNYQAGASSLSPTQNFQPDNGVGSDTLTQLCVDASGNVVRGSQEATWSFTNTQLNALSNTRVTLLASPGAGKAIVVEESNWFMESTGSNTGTFGSDLTCEIDGISSNSVATQMVKARMEEIAASSFGGLGIYSRDVPELNRVYRFNVPMTIRSKQGTNKFPSRCISIKLKIKYRVFDKATF